MNASQARQAVRKYRNELSLRYRKERAEADVIHQKKVAARWKERSSELIETINGYIEKAAAKGDTSIWEPSRINPNGDEIIFLENEDFIIKDMLMNYFRGEGFTVQDYASGGMKITWGEWGK